MTITLTFADVDLTMVAGHKSVEVPKPIRSVAENAHAAHL